jgi:hypothetical protein
MSLSGAARSAFDVHAAASQAFSAGLGPLGHGFAAEVRIFCLDLVLIENRF